MSYFKFSFLINVLLIFLGSIFKITHLEFGFINGNMLLTLGKLFFMVPMFFAFILMFKAKKMKLLQKFLWMILFGVTFVFLNGLVVLIPGLLFYFFALKRLNLKKNPQLKN